MNVGGGERQGWLMLHFAKGVVNVWGGERWGGERRTIFLDLLKNCRLNLDWKI